MFSYYIRPRYSTKKSSLSNVKSLIKNIYNDISSFVLRWWLNTVRWVSSKLINYSLLSESINIHQSMSRAERTRRNAKKRFIFLVGTRLPYFWFDVAISSSFRLILIMAGCRRSSRTTYVSIWLYVIKGSILMFTLSLNFIVAENLEIYCNWRGPDQEIIFFDKWVGSSTRNTITRLKKIISLEFHIKFYMCNFRKELINYWTGKCKLTKLQWK